MSYLEIYNEEINDLLAPEHRRLQIHESIERGIFVAGLREEIVASADQVLELMKFGEAHRHIGETNMNVYSSRSHTIFRMIIESREKSDDGEADSTCDAVRVSVLNLVDLAGSERAAKTGAEGVRLKEGSHINKSLMTLGTVIKKLSEGAESQGGHVPYRDSKLTRILQPALGGNANTAIICNITLAQVHADETKSSLQFASRALRVTNCAHVNEILTDAALLRRQKREIEELRAKLQGSKSEHLEEEILNLRNTLLKSELERERMALELEEEKRAQAERDKMLLEQAKKIENLSTMVLCANREETREFHKKEKRRDTWCPGNLAMKNVKEPPSVVRENISDVKYQRTDYKNRPLLPFSELINETNVPGFCKQDEDFKTSASEDCTLPDSHALLHVTNRRKVPVRKRSLPMDSNNLTEIQAEFENLLLEFETHRTVSDIQIDYLTRKLAEADCVLNEKCRRCIGQNIKPISNSKGDRDTDSILVIKQLQEKIATLEIEKTSSQQNLDSVVNLATDQTILAQAKCDKLYEELALAREEATLARDELASLQSSVVEFDWLNKLFTETEEIKLQFEKSKVLTESLYSVADELLQFPSSMLIHDLRDSYSQSLSQVESIAGSHEKIQSCLTHKVNKLEDEKRVLYNQVSELCSRIEELSLEVQNSANASMELKENHEAEKAEFQCQLQMLQKEISALSSSSLAKEKEAIRKEFEKTKLKLKDTESKLKNIMQEKTKLEGEKSSIERELKKLQSQKAMLERDVNKQASMISKRRDSTIYRSSNVFDQKQMKCSPALVELEDEYKKMEVLAFDMETTIASLEDQLEVANRDKDEANSIAERLSQELELSNSELSALEKEVSVLRTSLEESTSRAQKMEDSLKSLSEEKEDLSMQLTEALMTMEEEKAIWSSKEKASMEIIGEKEKHYNAEIASLSTKLSAAGSELQNCRQNIRILEENLKSLEESVAVEKQCRCCNEKEPEANHVSEQRTINGSSNGSPEVSNPKLNYDCQKHEEIEMLQLELSVLRKERQSLLAQVQELEQGQMLSEDESEVQTLKHELKQVREMLACMEEKLRNDQININKEIAKLRMRLHGTQTKLDTFRVRYQDTVDELEYMNRKYEEASAKLKKQLASYGIEVLDLKKQRASYESQVLDLTKQLAACRCTRQ
ncbi:kinesin-like protein KIN-7O isoform X2 [Andrographis paniculata]|nr:kinesin-like protein KIN-7O isoform X2 [Andrographis paniculata]